MILCGILAIFSHSPVASALYQGLRHLQHRGQDAAGIVTLADGFFMKHGLGLVDDIFSQTDCDTLKGAMGIAHTRYPTSGLNQLNDVQPFWMDGVESIALAHSGHLIHVDEYTQAWDLTSTVDSCVLMHLLMDALQAASESDFFTRLCSAVKTLFDHVQGAYSVVSLVVGKGLLAFRDPHGIRPLVMGRRVHSSGHIDYIVASEPTMFGALGYELMGDVPPGTVIYIDETGQWHQQSLITKRMTPCMFEYVYFAHYSSVLNTVAVNETRLAMGYRLACRWQEMYPDYVADSVVPIPTTACTAAWAFAMHLNLPYVEALVVNANTQRTFIVGDKDVRVARVHDKFTAIESAIRGKKILLLDDSIVRGTTSQAIVKQLRYFGAATIDMVIVCPPLRSPCHYGINIPTKDELLAAAHTVDQIRDFLGVDKLLYQTPADLIAAVNLPSSCMACML